MGIFLHLFYYIGHIILLSIELVNMYIFQIFKVHYMFSVILLYWIYIQLFCIMGIFLQLFYYFGQIILFSIELGNMSIFQDHEVCHSSAIILLLFMYY
jgi:hypothetical protein